jgi:hypothetical protein
MNCGDYKLSAFAEQSYSLAIIKVGRTAESVVVAFAV